MFHFKIFRKFLLPGRPHIGALCAAAALSAEGEKAPCGISKAIEEASKTESCKHCHAPPKLRPSELPLYGSEQEKGGREEEVEVPSGLEQMIGVVRKEVWTFYGQYKDYQLKVLEVVETGKAHSESALSFLREEATTVHRAGAIGLGGLAGLVMGLRSGWFKRILYGTTGATAMAALCYPRESSEIADQSLQMAKYYFTIAYNFVYGVKPEKFLSTSTVGSDKPSNKGSTPPVPDQIGFPVEKEEPPTPVPQVEEIPKITKIPTLKVTSEEVISETYNNVSASCSCPDPAIGSHEPSRYPNCSDKLDKLGEMISDVVYWGFCFVDIGSPCF